ncbi:hypothetical protein V8C42DRAFT_317843 [Trichoderma barbatum]
MAVDGQLDYRITGTVCRSTPTLWGDRDGSMELDWDLTCYIGIVEREKDALRNVPARVDVRTSTGRAKGRVFRARLHTYQTGFAAGRGNEEAEASVPEQSAVPAYSLTHGMGSLPTDAVAGRLIEDYQRSDAEHLHRDRKELEACARNRRRTRVWVLVQRGQSKLMKSELDRRDRDQLLGIRHAVARYEEHEEARPNRKKGLTSAMLLAGVAQRIVATSVAGGGRRGHWPGIPERGAGPSLFSFCCCWL